MHTYDFLRLLSGSKDLWICTACPETRYTTPGGRP